MRNLGAEAFEMPVHSPHRRRYPAEAAFDEHDLETRETLWHAFENQARQRCRHRMRIRLVLFGIVGRPAAAGRRVAAMAADVNTEREAKLLRTRIDRPIAMAAERLIGPRRHVDLHILADPGAALHLGDGRLGIVLTDEDRRFQPRLPAGPVRKLPFIDGALDRST